MIKGAIIIIAFALAGAIGTHFFHPRAPAWYLVDEQLNDDEVSLAEIDKRWHGDVLWIDARMRDQFDKGHVPGAILLNEYELDALLIENLEKLQDNKKPIIIYCDGLACHASRKMRTYLVENMAILDVWVLRGGWPAWTAAQPSK